METSVKDLEMDNNNVEKNEAEKVQKTQCNHKEQDLTEVEFTFVSDSLVTTKAENCPDNFGKQGESLVDRFAYQPLTHSIFPFSVSSAAERIRFILGDDDDGQAPPQLFTELDELLAVDGQEMEWKETAR